MANSRTTTSRWPGLAGGLPPREARRAGGTIAIVGFGKVGQALARRLEERHGWSGTRRWTVVAAFDSTGATLGAEGIDLPAALERKNRTGRLTDEGSGRCTVEEGLRQVNPDVVVELTRGGPETGEPGTQHILNALSGGADVLTANKSPIALNFARIHTEAGRVEREVRFGTTVGGVVPILETAAGLVSAAGPRRVEAILNGTTQFVLELLSVGVSFARAIAMARRQGITEADPGWDLSGYDASVKAAILHRCLFSEILSPREIPRDPVTEETSRVARDAASRGLRLVSLAEVTPGRAEVRLRTVPRGSRWDAPGSENVFRIETSASGTLWLQGLGAGPDAIAASLLGDLEALPRFGRGASIAEPGGRRQTARSEGNSLDATAVRLGDLQLGRRPGPLQLAVESRTSPTSGR